MDGTFDEGRRALEGRLDRLQDELESSNGHGRSYLDILHDIDTTEELLAEHDRLVELDREASS